MADQGDSLSAGTQVVSLVEVRGTHDSLVCPRGASGVVPHTPAGQAKTSNGQAMRQSRKKAANCFPFKG